LRGRLGLLAGIVTVLALSGVPAAGADETAPGRLTGDDPAHAAGQDGSADPAAATPVPLPDLGITHRLADGGMNLYRMPLSELELGYGEPQLVRRLPASQGWRYDRSVVLTGDFGDITAGDDGTADWVIWHANADGSIKVWLIGGGSDTTPRHVMTLPRRAGWNWADSRPTVGDVDGDGWDDLVVRHRRNTPWGWTASTVWLLVSDGSRLGAPQKWGDGDNLDISRVVVGDFLPDWRDDVLSVALPSNRYMQYAVGFTNEELTSQWSANWMFQGFASDGWSFHDSRQLAGDVTGDGLDDVLTVHRAGTGLLVWNQASCSTGPSDDCREAPEAFASLRAGGWSWANSRQYLADTNGDYVDDLISVHRGGTGGLLVWRHVSNGAAFSPPEIVVDLRTGGWNWSASREGVANTWGWYE
jgi:hypothetical protein